MNLTKLYLLLSLPFLFLQSQSCNTPKQNFQKETSMKEDAAKSQVRLEVHPDKKRVDVLLDDELFTSYIYPDNISKPVLYPIITKSGKKLTRGYPLEKMPNERVDHPHHIGYWFNYGDVNGLDFWNNSEAIASDRKHRYGHIQHESIIDVKSGKQQGELRVQTNWLSPNENILLEEETNFIFKAIGNTRIIDRITKLTAKEEASFDDNKEGMVAVRVTRALELPTTKATLLTDANGNKIDTKSINNEGVNGDYLSSEGVTGKKVWGTRAKWMKLHSIIDKEPVALVLIDHPQNVGYPTYWHARDYGLFSANPLGQKVFSKGKEELRFKLKKGESVTFRYRLLVHGGEPLSTETIEQFANDFAKK